MSEAVAFVTHALSTPLFQLGKASITIGGLLAAMAFVVGVWWFSSLLESSTLRLTRRYADESWKFARIHMLSRLLRYTVWVLGTLIGLNYLGIDLTSIALLGSAFAVGLGFGLQNVFSNFVSGVIILLERSLKVGDFVDLQSGVRGHVREIAMRYTRVTSNDALDILVPNSEFINGRVVNWTFDDSNRRMHVPFGVAYGTKKELVREAGIAAAATVDGVLEDATHKTQVWLVAVRRQLGELRAHRLGRAQADHPPGLDPCQADVGAGRRTGAPRHRDPVPATGSACAQRHASGAPRWPQRRRAACP